jgi:hypothetical protein
MTKPSRPARVETMLSRRSVMQTLSRNLHRWQTSACCACDGAQAAADYRETKRMLAGGKTDARACKTTVHT